jgi:hypothetical protein
MICLDSLGFLENKKWGSERFPTHKTICVLKIFLCPENFLENESATNFEVQNEGGIFPIFIGYMKNLLGFRLKRFIPPTSFSPINLKSRFSSFFEEFHDFLRNFLKK